MSKIQIKYYTLRRFDTTIHVKEIQKAKGVVIMPCVGDSSKYEKVQEHKHKWFEANGYKRVGAVNGGFFGTGRIIPYGLYYVDNGVRMSDTTKSDAWMELIHESGSYSIDDLTTAELVAKYPKANWGISLSYSLIINGKIDIRKGHEFPWTKERHPRTLIGDNKEKYIHVVAEGRAPGANPKQLGLTAQQSAEVMLELGCVTAINADGGWSTAMVLNGKVMNASYIAGGQRKTADAILVYVEPGYDFEIVGINDKENTNSISAKKKIIFDIGHGIDTYPPNKGIPGLPEFEFNNAVVKEAKTLAEHNGFEVILTQPLDGKNVSLSQRSKAANDSGGAILMSFHADASVNKNAKGHWCFHWHSSSNGKRLAELWSKNAKGFPNPSRGIIQSRLNNWTNFHILRETKMPSVLMEHGFMTNPNDLELLKSDVFRKLAAVVAVKTVCDYFGIKFKPISSL